MKIEIDKENNITITSEDQPKPDSYYLDKFGGMNIEFDSNGKKRTVENTPDLLEQTCQTINAEFVRGIFINKADDTSLMYFHGDFGHPSAGTIPEFTMVSDPDDYATGARAVAIGSNAYADSQGIAIGNARAKAGEVKVSPGSYVEPGITIGGYTFDGSENPTAGPTSIVIGR